MLTGSNAFSVRGSYHKNPLKEKLLTLQEKHYDLCHVNNQDSFSFDELSKLEHEIKHVEYLIWCEEYEQDRKRIWK